MSNSRDPSRGNAEARRRRKVWLLGEYGDGKRVRCFYCPEVLTASTLTVDRIRPAVARGTYARSNIRPACGTCNTDDGNRIKRRMAQGQPLRDEPKLTPAQMRLWIQLRCNPYGVGRPQALGIPRRKLPTLEVLERHGLVWIMGLPITRSVVWAAARCTPTYTWSVTASAVADGPSFETIVRNAREVWG